MLHQAPSSLILPRLTPKKTKTITLCTLLKIQQLHMIPADWIETLVSVFTSEDQGLIFMGEKLLKEMQKIIRAIIKHAVK